MQYWIVEEASRRGKARSVIQVFSMDGPLPSALPLVDKQAPHAEKEKNVWYHSTNIERNFLALTNILYHEEWSHFASGTNSALQSPRQ